MRLEFLNQLDESQIIDLINYVLPKKEEKEGNNLTKKAQTINIFNEPNRRDEKGNQQILVGVWNGCFHVGSYFINDYNMNDSYNNSVYSTELREYMVSIFGDDYLQGLEKYYHCLASEECERLRNINSCQKIKTPDNTRKQNIG